MSQTSGTEERAVQCEHIKQIVKATFEKLIKTETLLSDNQKIKSALKRDLSDLAEGRVDRIVERHEIDTVSKEESVFQVMVKIEVGAKNNSPWYVPYIVKLDGEEMEINNSVAKTYAKGSYKLDNGEIKYL